MSARIPPGSSTCSSVSSSATAALDNSDAAVVGREAFVDPTVLGVVSADFEVVLGSFETGLGEVFGRSVIVSKVSVGGFGGSPETTSSGVVSTAADGNGDEISSLTARVLETKVDAVVARMLLGSSGTGEDAFGTVVDVLEGDTVWVDLALAKGSVEVELTVLDSVVLSRLEVETATVVASVADEVVVEVGATEILVEVPVPDPAKGAAAL